MTREDQIKEIGVDLGYLLSDEEMSIIELLKSRNKQNIEIGWHALKSIGVKNRLQWPYIEAVLQLHKDAGKAFKLTSFKPRKKSNKTVVDKVLFCNNITAIDIDYEQEVPPTVALLTNLKTLIVGTASKLNTKPLENISSLQKVRLDMMPWDLDDAILLPKIQSVKFVAIYAYAQLKDAERLFQSFYSKGFCCAFYGSASQKAPIPASETTPFTELFFV